MANMSIPEFERNLNPAQVAVLDKRRQWGLVFQVIAGQLGRICGAGACTSTELQAIGNRE
jgi:hypothetical protein